jgi:hypothetical protein
MVDQSGLSVSGLRSKMAIVIKAVPAYQMNLAGLSDSSADFAPPQDLCKITRLGKINFLKKRRTLSET